MIGRRLVRNLVLGPDGGLGLAATKVEAKGQTMGLALSLVVTLALSVTWGIQRPLREYHVASDSGNTLQDGQSHR